MRGGDSDASVADLHEQRFDWFTNGPLRGYPHAAARRRKLDRVADQVADDVRDLLAIGGDRRKIRHGLDGEREPLLLEQRSVENADLLENFADREPRRHERELVRRSTRVGQNLTDLIEQLAPTIDDAADTFHLTRREITKNS